MFGFPVEIGLTITVAYLLAAVLIVWNIHTRFVATMLAGIIALLTIFTPLFSPYRITVFIMTLVVLLAGIVTMAGHVTLQWVQRLTETLRS